MIPGRFEDGQPLVEAKVWLPALQLKRKIFLLVDTSTPHSQLSAADLQLNVPLSFPMDDAFAQPVRGGMVSALRIKAFLTFQHDAGRSALSTINIAVVDDAPGESRLGRDILNDWLMVYDQPGDSLLFEPLT